MNKRIKELAEQAWVDTEEKFGCFIDDFGEANFTFLHAYDKNFAELIVRECCQKLENDGMVEVAMEMKQHFGVKE